MQPVIKWSGSKRSVAKEIAALYPVQTGARFIDPFVGGGSILAYRPCKRALAGDIIKSLVDVWKLIQAKPEEVADQYRIRWNKLQKYKDIGYYRIRRRYNQLKSPHDFLFLTRTCVNGAVRFNAQGEFNQAFHFSRPGIDPISFHLIIHQWSELLRDVSFRSQDYHETLAHVRAGDCVFLDPPYFHTKGQYQPGTFTLEPFLAELERLNQIGAKWVLTYDGRSRQETEFIPKALYLRRFKLNTGGSSMRRMQGKTHEVSESLYTNFQPRGFERRVKA